MTEGKPAMPAVDRTTTFSAAELVERLGSDFWSDRRMAEDRLSHMGAAAVPALIEALNDGSERRRWGAAKVFTKAPDPAAVPALVQAIEDPNGGVRWLASEALVAIGQPSVVPLLRRLLSKADSPWVQEGAHHVLRSLSTPTVTPVVRALEERFPELTVPVAANAALKALE